MKPTWLLLLLVFLSSFSMKSMFLLALLAMANFTAMAQPVSLPSDKGLVIDPPKGEEPLVPEKGTALPFSQRRPYPGDNYRIGKTVVFPRYQLVLQERQKPWSWDGQCQVECIDGSCRGFCSSGVVYARSYGEARLKAEARLRAEASRYGRVISGSISVSVEFDI